MFNLISLKNGLENVDGFFFGGVSTGLKPNGDNDLGFIRANDPFMLSAKFTSNKFQAAPIVHFKRYEKGFDLLPEPPSRDSGGARQDGRAHRESEPRLH